MKPAVFVLTYTDIEYMNKWIDIAQYKNIDLYILNNGTQDVPDRLKPYVIHNVKRNIFCAGGWNLICKIAFNSLGYDKIVITQDDLQFTEQQVIDTLEHVTPGVMVGGRSDIFYYSFFGIHKNTYTSIGEFDESFIEVTCEDNDYHYRALLNGIKHVTMHYQMPNANLSSSKLSWKFGNKEYLLEKWGPEKSWGAFTFKTPFNGARPCHKINRPEYFDRRDWSIYGITNPLDYIHNTNGSDLEYKNYLDASTNSWNI